MTPAATDIDAAVAALRRGGVVAYPTEAVYGLGCDPANAAALDRIFALKERPAAQGVLLIAADYAQLAPYLDLRQVPGECLATAMASWPGPNTWIFPRSDKVPEWIARDHPGIAVRVTDHPLAAALCRAFGGPLVSTSANRHGEPPARNAAEVRMTFGERLDVLLDGPVGGLERPTPIRDAITGEFVRR
ncbi:L-threonylcarbamoyladenylate synthase [Tahibacter amnicola]|uniref:Threonylcarbamoyl-AMP synthase n=1 Tax=Tahibacter amnicola TaxID=2976241 RepID=A0ABY6BCQ6_9GAMM|nr:Sua5/YciO/YrdC/YwlC family protein [Tahibacter amnicola]UXI67821.1 Sua5/YciO/YrdC/YwlC family protein [Tahibacter amnicola]